MFKLVVPVVVVLILAIGGFFLYQNFQTKPTSEPNPPPQTLIPTSSPTGSTDPCEVLTKGSSDVPPIYKKGITWQQPKITEFDVPLGSDIGSRIMSGCLIKSTTNDESALKVRAYYLETLTRSSWKMVVQGDAPFGGLDSFQKEDRYFVVNLESDVILSSGKVVTIFYTQ